MQANQNGNRRLDSWKEIAAHLGRNERTAIRWEKKGLPVHRVPGGQRQAVFAYTAEIDAWLISQDGKTTPSDSSGEALAVSSLEARPILHTAPKTLFSSADETPSPTKNESDLQTTIVSPSPLQGTSTNPHESTANTRLALRRYRLFAGIGLVLAVAFLATIPLRRGLQAREHPFAAQPRVIVRQSREIHSPMVTDGTQLYFPECINGRFQIARVNVKAAESETIPLPSTLKSVDLADISPDGNTLLVREIPRFETDTARFYLQPTDGRPAIRLNNVQGLDGTWSPNGTRIYFGDYGKIYMARTDGSAPEVFVDNLPGRPFWLRWSPDGKILRFTLIQGHLNTIWETTTVDQRTRQLNLTEDGGDFWCCGNWDSTGTLYFYQSRTNGVFQIWKRLEQSGKLMPFEQALDDYRGPVPGRTGGILFARTETRRAELQRLDSSSGLIEAVLPQISISTAALSPDGEWIAYSTFPNHGLYVSRRDGTQRRLLTPPNLEAALPAWSPDGKWIAYMTRTRGWWEVYIVSAQGGEAKLLLDTDHIDVRDPNWSADGNQILVGYGPVIRDKANSSALYTVDIASHKLGQPIPGSEGLFSPRWSPDGKYIAALSTSASRLLVYDRSTGWRPLIEDHALGYPNWSSNSKSLYVLDATGPGNFIKQIHLPDLKVETYADLTKSHQPCTMFGTWLGIDGDLPLFIKDTSTRLVGAFKYDAP